MSLRILYFAWLRERVGLAEETVDVPAGTITVRDLVAWLKERGEGYACAFENEGIVRTALDRVHAKPDSPLAGVREIAFFPPMTGG